MFTYTKLLTCTFSQCTCMQCVIRHQLPYSFYVHSHKPLSLELHACISGKNPYVRVQEYSKGINSAYSKWIFPPRIPPFELSTQTSRNINISRLCIKYWPDLPGVYEYYLFNTPIYIARFPLFCLVQIGIQFQVSLFCCNLVDLTNPY